MHSLTHSLKLLFSNLVFFGRNCHLQDSCLALVKFSTVQNGCKGKAKDFPSNFRVYLLNRVNERNAMELKSSNCVFLPCREFPSLLDQRRTGGKKVFSFFYSQRWEKKEKDNFSLSPSLGLFSSFIFITWCKLCDIRAKGRKSE